MGCVHLTGFFTGKSDERLAEIFDALDNDQPAPLIDYTVLFSETVDCEQSLFAETIKGQHLAERIEYLQVSVLPTPKVLKCQFCLGLIRISWRYLAESPGIGYL